MSVSTALWLAAAVTTVAAIVDVRRRRIPNWLTFSALGVGLLVNGWQTGASGVATALVGAALGLAALLPFYLAHAVGAGDVKLLAAVGALAGPQVLVSVAVYGAIVGGLLAIMVLIKYGRLMAVLGALSARRSLPSRRITAPYGVAIASGVYLAMLLPGVIR